MKYATHRGYRIAYDVEGDGPPVVLQHGLMDNRKRWAEVGYVAGLKDSYRVICVDSLGHGDSDKPKEEALYQREQRAGDIAAVLDNENIAKAHYVGYSMGGWIGSGLAVYQADRLLSLTIGGWDTVEGTARPMSEFERLGTQTQQQGAPPDFESVLKLTQQMTPGLSEWVTDEVKPGLAACWRALTDVTGSAEALAALDVPILLWTGKDDSCIDGNRALAARLDKIATHEVPGDHPAAFLTHVDESLAGIRKFLDKP